MKKRGGQKRPARPRKDRAGKSRFPFVKNDPFSQAAFRFGLLKRICQSNYREEVSKVTDSGLAPCRSVDGIQPGFPIPHDPN